MAHFVSQKKAPQLQGVVIYKSFRYAISRLPLWLLLAPQSLGL